jgi:hypothetical protein
LMQGRKDQKDGNETRKTGELDGWALVDDLRTFVEETELSLPKNREPDRSFQRNPQYVGCRNK